MFQLLDSSGKVIDTLPAFTAREMLITLAIAAMISHRCEITITRNGNFHDRIKYRKVGVLCF